MILDTYTLILIFLALCGAGILLSLAPFLSRPGWVLAWMGCIAAFFLGLAGANALLTGDTFSHALWSLPGLGTLTLRLDGLSALFLSVTGLVLFPTSIFAGGELNREWKRDGSIVDRNKAARLPESYGRVFTIMMFGLYATIALVFLAGDALLFLLSWEVMSILCYLLIVCSREKENGHAGSGYLLLAMGEAGTLAVVLGFLLLAVNAGSLDFGCDQIGFDRSGRRHALGCFSPFVFRVRCEGWNRAGELLAPPRLCGRAACVRSGAGRRDTEPRPLWNSAGQRRADAADTRRAGFAGAYHRHAFGAGGNSICDNRQ